jgi:hypothetical protein
MQTATVMAKAQTTIEPDLWREFQRAMAHRHFIRALALARRLSMDEQRIRALQREVLRQFLVEYQNFDGANRLQAEYGLTAEELTVLMNELLPDKELETRTTFFWHTGKSVYLSVATQLHLFFTSLLKRMRRRKIQWKIVEEWRQWVARLHSWFDRSANSGRGRSYLQKGFAK